MEIQDFLGIGIIGVGASFLIEWITNKFGTNSFASKGVAIATALIIGTAYFFIRSTVWFPTVIGVLASASTVYALFFKK